MLELYRECSGVDFNEYYKNTKFYKFLNDDLEYKLGLNIDNIPFDLTNGCLNGGFHFYEESKCHLYFDNYCEKRVLIEIPDDARVYVEKDEFISDRIIVKEIIVFSDIDDNFWIDMAFENSSILQYVKDPLTTNFLKACKIAIQRNGLALRYVKEQTLELCILAVQRNGNALQYVNVQTEDICKLAVKNDGNALYYVKDQTKDICILAVQQNGLALRFVKDQTKDICILAVQQNGFAIEFVKDSSGLLTEELRTLAKKQQNSFASKFGTNYTKNTKDTKYTKYINFMYFIGLSILCVDYYNCRTYQNIFEYVAENAVSFIVGISFGSIVGSVVGRML